MMEPVMEVFVCVSHTVVECFVGLFGKDGMEKCVRVCGDYTGIYILQILPSEP